MPAALGRGGSSVRGTIMGHAAIRKFEDRRDFNRNLAYQIGDRNPRAAAAHERRANRYAAAVDRLKARINRGA